MSLKVGTLVESHLSMICPQTTHLATLLSMSDSREYVTAYRAPQWGQKKLGPSGIAPVRGIGTPPNSEPICSLKRTNSRGARPFRPFLEDRPTRMLHREGPELRGEDKA